MTNTNESKPVFILFFSAQAFTLLFPLTCRPSRRRRSVGVANATDPPLLMSTMSSIEANATTVLPDDEDSSKVPPFHNKHVM